MKTNFNQMNIEELYRYYQQAAGVTTDTRTIEKGTIFFALKGDNFNGNRFAEEAIKKGAAYAVIDEPLDTANDRLILVDDVLETLQQLANHHRRQLTIPVIGITGSNGKTTTKELIREVLSQKFTVTSTQGNLNNHIGVPLTLLSIDKETEIAIVEMGANHQHEIGFLCNIAEPKYGLITSIGKSHLEGFGSMENLINTKKELYDALENNNGVVFFNQEDNLLSKIVPTSIQHLSYGTSEEVYCRGMINDRESFYFAFDLFGDAGRITSIKTRLTGSYNFTNALAASAVGRYFGVSDEEIKIALEEYAPGNNRSQIQQTSNNTLILDAYNANPSSMTLAIDNLNTIDHHDKFFILGDMLELGEISREEHRSILNQLRKNNLKGVLIGSCFYELQDEFSEFDFYPTTDEYLTKLKETPLKDKLILIKGSRGIRLEKCVECL